MENEFLGKATAFFAKNRSEQEICIYCKRRMQLSDALDVPLGESFEVRFLRVEGPWTANRHQITRNHKSPSTLHEQAGQQIGIFLHDTFVGAEDLAVDVPVGSHISELTDGLMRRCYNSGEQLPIRSTGVGSERDLHQPNLHLLYRRHDKASVAMSGQCGTGDGKIGRS